MSTIGNRGAFGAAHERLDFTWQRRRAAAFFGDSKTRDGILTRYLEA